MKLGVAILAAGFSSRMGQPKMVLPWNSTTILGHLIAVWTKPTAQLAVVCPPGENAVSAELDRLEFPPQARIINSEPERGMFSSVQCAARWDGWSPELTHYALALGDQPQIRTETISTLIEHAIANPNFISQPEHGGRPKHPIIFPKSAFLALAEATCATLRDFLDSQLFPRSMISISDSGLDVDLDYPADYQSARKQFLENQQ